MSTLFSRKIQLVLSSRSFPQTFSPDLLENIFFLSFKALFRKQKRLKALVQGLLNMVDRVEQTNLNSVFFPVWFLLNMTLHCQKGGHFSYWRVQGVFMEDFYAHFAAVEIMSALSVWLWFKNSKSIIPMILPYTQHNFSSMKLCLWSRLWKFILVNPLPFALNIVRKDPSFITCNDILEKWVISLPWKKTCCYGYVIFLILLTKCMRKLNAQLSHFFYPFQVIVDCRLRCVVVKF